MSDRVSRVEQVFAWEVAGYCGILFSGVLTILILILIIAGPLSSTFARASVRIRQAYAEGSRCSYYNKFNILLSFCNHYKLNVKRLTVNNCISFLEILANYGLSTATIAPYISAIKAKCSEFGIHYASWSHPRVAL